MSGTLASRAVNVKRISKRQDAPRGPSGVSHWSGVQ